MSLEIMADDDAGYDEITPFLSAMKKIKDDSKKIGFINRFSTNERMVLMGIWEKIKDDAQTTIETVDKKTSQGI